MNKNNYLCRPLNILCGSMISLSYKHFCTPMDLKFLVFFKHAQTPGAYLIILISSRYITIHLFCLNYASLEEIILSNYGGISKNNLSNILITDIDDPLIHSPYCTPEDMCTALKDKHRDFTILSLNCQSLQAK